MESSLTSDIFAFLRWYLAAAAAGLLALPLSFRLFRLLPDRGFSFARPLGILAIGWAYWMLGSLGFVRSSAGGVLAAALLVGGLSAAWLGRGGWGELRDFLRAERGALLRIELLFLLAFAGWALVRAYNPNIEGTEKPMEFMFINSILRSGTFPPQDAWLSGHAISYYYFGYLMIAAFTQITATASAVSFNLGLALLFALSAVGALGVVMNLIALSLRSRAAPNTASALRRSFAPALLAPLILLLVGNLYGALELAHRRAVLAQTSLPVLYYDFGQIGGPGPDGQPTIERMPAARFGPVNFWEWLDLKQLNTPPQAAAENPGWSIGNWFFAARVVHDRNLLGTETEAIDENPAFSFLLGDMHPHVLALPFGLLASGLALQWLLAGREWGRERRAWRSLIRTEWPFVLLSGLVLGALIFLNTWDFPIYAFLCALALVYGLASTAGRAGFQRRWQGPAGLLGTALAVCLALYWPYLLTAQSQVQGILPNLIYPTRFQQTLVMFLPVLFGVAMLLLALRGPGGDRRWGWTAGAGLLALLIAAAGLLSALALSREGTSAMIAGFLAPLTLEQAPALLLQRRLVDSLTALSMAVLVGLAASRLAGSLPRYGPASDWPDTLLEEETPAPPQGQALDSAAAVGLALAMTLTGAMLVLGPEFVYVWDGFSSRMNTIFKFYFQAWALWSLAGAYGIWLLYQRARTAGRAALVAAAALTVLTGGVYLYGSLLSKTDGFAGPPTLNGMAYFARSYPDDWAAIQWLDQFANGDPPPVVLEGTRGSYWMDGRSSRVAMATGLPTLMGWIGHEIQWRGDYYYEGVSARPAEIEQIYSERDWAATQTLLDRYGIQYVVLSPLERDWYRAYQPKFDAFMTRVFEAGDIVIYGR